jgi:sugar lactone lactonase YvrE
MVDAEPVAGPVAHHCEGPFWDAPTRRLLTMDVLSGAVVSLDEWGETSRYQLPTRVVTAIRRRTSGGFVIATEDGLIGVDNNFAIVDRIADVNNDPGVRTNDGGCDPLGGFLIGTMAYDESPFAGALYRVGPDHQVVQVLSRVTISNGIQWSADGTRVFYVDTPTKRVDVFDVDQQTGTWSRRRDHIHISAPGYPDGMAIDEDDGLWVALWGAGAVNHYDKRGQLVETVRVPGVTQVSSCAFGGDHRDVLYITTSRLGLPEGQEPSAGAVFAVHTSSRGAVPWEFAG